MFSKSSHCARSCAFSKAIIEINVVGRKLFSVNLLLGKIKIELTRNIMLWVDILLLRQMKAVVLSANGNV